MPMERAILWNPVKKEGGRPSGRAPYPVFFQQEAVVALQDHHKASPQQAIFGFLAGTLYRDPETGVLYAVIDKTLRLNQAIYGDKTEVVVARLWDRMQEQLARASGRLLGWYHSHPGQSLSLTTHDVETHVKFFTEPWQVAVLVAAEQEGVIGGFFRSGSSQAWAETPLAFYELLQPDSIRADGKTHLKSQPIAEIAEALDPARFVRIHRSYVLNVERIARLELYAKDSRVAILKEGKQLPVSRAGYARLKELL